MAHPDTKHTDVVARCRASIANDNGPNATAYADRPPMVSTAPFSTQTRGGDAVRRSPGVPEGEQLGVQSNVDNEPAYCYL